MGKAINISRSGILLETPRSIDSERLLLMTVDQDDNLIEMTGRLVYCKQAASGMYHAGVKFVGSDEEISRFTVKLIKLYHRRKHGLLIQASL
jgi:hypothetical protein